MLGNPKFEINNIVSFTIQDKNYVGTVHNIDKYGTFENNEIVSYDIMIVENNKKCIIKHVPEYLLSAVENKNI